MSFAKTLRWWSLPFFAVAVATLAPGSGLGGQPAAGARPVGGGAGGAFEIAAPRFTPNLAGQIDRPLRYRPDGEDFVILNGAETFNRPLYGGHTAFRVDGGDRPEFVLYLPGRGGNLRFALQTVGGTRWLHEAAVIETRYRPGELRYEIRDPLLGDQGVLRLAAVVSARSEQLLVRIEAAGVAADAQLWLAFGGVHGERGRRDGDIGTEDVPISTWFQLQPKFCTGNIVEVRDRSFAVVGKPGRVEGRIDAAVELSCGDARAWTDLTTLIRGRSPAPPEQPIVLARVALDSTEPRYASLRFVAAGTGDRDLAVYADVSSDAGRGLRTPTATSGASSASPPSARAGGDVAHDAAAEFAAAEQHFAAVRRQLSVDTPDPFLNAAVGALNVAADALWDERQQAIMHGAIAWRTRLLGWRGPYALDALGWHERFRRHARYWISRQNTEPLRADIPPPEEKTNLARNPAGLHANGDFSNSHYDMNLVFIDALFRHLAWTDDVAFAREVWPAVERHLAWERRLFRRTFGPEALPLYEAYAAIWASDDLQYSGGGVAHASAYNAFHHAEAARWAGRLGLDASPYAREAKLITRALRELLWVTDAGLEWGGATRDGPTEPLPLGWFAENKDWLGAQRVRPSAALWTVYHTIDSRVTAPTEAWQLTEYVRRELPHLPVRGAGVPRRDFGSAAVAPPGIAPEDLATVATSNWMPYDWSLNNVVMAEAVHAALAFWQAGRPDEAWALTKGSLLAAMYLGISPGNVGSMSYLDVYRRESQRDFADGAGVLSRALVEGLFGVVPDAAEAELTVTPGWPLEWNRAALRQAGFELQHAREGRAETYRMAQHPPSLEGRAPRPPVQVRFRLRARTDTIEAVTVNGAAASWRIVEDALDHPRIEVTAPAAGVVELRVLWGGREIMRVAADGAGMPTAEPGFRRLQQGQMSWLRPPAYVTSPVAERRAAVISALAGKAGAPTGRLETLTLTPFFNAAVTDLFRQEYRSPRSPFVSLALPKQGLGGWAGGFNRTAEIDDAGLRAAAAGKGGRLELPNGVVFVTPTGAGARNIIFVSCWDNYPDEATVPLDGMARRLHLLVAGTALPLHSQGENARIVVTYVDGTTAVLPLVNPETWWPIEQDFFTDDYQFHHRGALPVRVDLATGRARDLSVIDFRGRGGPVPGGAATALTLVLDPAKPLKSLTLKAIANDVVVGVMAVSLER